jgi:hypothetical protein
MEHLFHEEGIPGKEKFNGRLDFFKVIIIIKFDFFVDRFMAVSELF